MRAFDGWRWDGCRLVWLQTFAGWCVGREGQYSRGKQSITEGGLKNKMENGWCTDEKMKKGLNESSIKMLDNIKQGRDGHKTIQLNCHKTVESFKNIKWPCSMHFILEFYGDWAVCDADFFYSMPSSICTQTIKKATVLLSLSLLFWTSIYASISNSQHQTITSGIIQACSKFVHRRFECCSFSLNKLFHLILGFKDREIHSGKHFKINLLFVFHEVQRDLQCHKKASDDKCVYEWTQFSQLHHPFLFKPKVFICFQVFHMAVPFPKVVNYINCFLNMQIISARLRNCCYL